MGGQPVTQPDTSDSAPLPHVIEGELVRDVWDYEYDDLEVGGADLKTWIETQLGPGRPVDDDDTKRQIHYGRVRLTLEPLE